MLFDLPHILFMLISGLALVVSLTLCRLFVKSQKTKNVILKIAAWSTVIIHFSVIYVDYFTTGTAQVGANLILPIYPCNIAMWFLLAVALIKNKESKVFKTLAEITFYLGIVGGIFGIALNEVYSNNPNLANWDVMNGLLSHATLLFGCIYLLVGGYIKIRVSNVISIIIGLLFLFVDGWLMIGLFRIFKLDPPNTMYLLEPPVAAAPWFNTYLIGIVAIVLFFTITAIFEQIALKKEERWYNKLKNRRKN